MRAIDPMTEFDQEVATQRAREAQRDADESILCALFQTSPGTAALECAKGYRRHGLPEGEYPLDTMAGRAQAFAASYGWPGVFRVLAAAIHRHDQFIDRR